MALKTGRFYECAEVEIDKGKCTICGLCVKVCKGAPLFIEDKIVKVDHDLVIFGHPDVKYSFALKRRFANIKFY